MVKTIYDRLKTDLKQELNESAVKYSSAERLKYTLMSKTGWQELTISELSDVLTYTNLSSWKVAPYGFMYGDNILQNEDE